MNNTRTVRLLLAGVQFDCTPLRELGICPTTALQLLKKGAAIPCELRRDAEQMTSLRYEANLPESGKGSQFGLNTCHGWQYLRKLTGIVEACAIAILTNVFRAWGIDVFANGVHYYVMTITYRLDE